MPFNLNAHADNTTPKIAFREVTGVFNPTKADKNKLESVSHAKAVDLLCEGPVEGFCDATGGPVSGSGILKGIYINDVPIQVTTRPGLGEREVYNFRTASSVFVHGDSGQMGVYTGQGTTNHTPTDNDYWLEDFSYASKTLGKGIHLPAAKALQNNETAIFKASHAVMDPDVDWLNMSFIVNECWHITNDGNQTGASGILHVWGDITGISHRSLAGVQPIPEEGAGGRHVYIDFSGLALSPYSEDVLFKLKDYDGEDGVNRNRTVYVRNLSEERDSFRSMFSIDFGTVTEITKKNLSYPYSAYVGTLLEASEYSSIPRRAFDLRLKRIRVPSNYTHKEDGPNGPVEDSDGESLRHIGAWDGTFKEDLEWTDNPAWILLDLISNDRYGLGEYIKDINIDKWQLYQIAKYCDQLVPISKLKENYSESSTDPSRFKKERRYTCNILLNNKMEAYRAINEMASIFQGIAYFNSNQIFISQDTLKDPIINFTNDNVVDGAFEYSGASKNARFTTVKVAYKDKDENFFPKYEYIEDAEGIKRYGLIEKEVAAIGCTSRDQALRLGRWILLTSNKEEEIVKFKTNREGEYIKPGDVFGISDELRNQYKSGGRIKSIVNNKSSVNENFILLDQQLDTGNYNFTSISLLIPRAHTSGDSSSLTNQFQKFVHRDGQYLSSPVLDERLVAIPLDSASSSNTSLNNYIENTISGAKILTHETEDLILYTGGSGDYVDDDSLGKGFRSFNDYLLSSGVLKTIRDGSSRSQNTEKLEERAIYVVEASGDASNKSDITSKEYRVISVTEEGQDSYGVVGMEYDRSKFEDVASLSNVYRNSTFPLVPTIKPNVPGGPEPSNPDLNVTHPLKPVLGYPKENKVELIVKPTGYINTQGEARSKVHYYFHNTDANADYYSEEQADRGAYRIRAQEVSDSYHLRLVNTLENGEPILQTGKFIVSGKQDCGDYTVLYDGNNPAQFGGTADKAVSISNYLQNTFEEVSPPGELERQRIVAEQGTLYASGCYTGLKDGKWHTSEILTDVLSGEFELPNPEKYYELRWSEKNRHGFSPEKALFFRASRDTTPPGPCTSFRADLGLIYRNFINFKWGNPGDSDLKGVRVYTGHIGGDVASMPGNSEFDQLDWDSTLEQYVPRADSHLFAFDGAQSTNFPYEADTSDGTLRDLDGNSIGFGNSGVFHIRAFDKSNNPSSPINSNVISVIEYADGPQLHLSGEVRDYPDPPQLHIFYSGTFHKNEGFKHYSIAVSEPNNAQRWREPILIGKGDIEVAPSSFTMNPYGSGHIAVSALANTNYYVKLKAVSSDDRETNYTNANKLIGRDGSAPNPITNFKVEKQASNYKVSWDAPKEKDCNQVILYTGSGQSNFQVNEDSSPAPTLLSSENGNNEKFSPLAARRPNDFIILPGNDPLFGQGGSNATRDSFRFHIVPVDTSDNTGMYTGYTLNLTSFDSPEVHTSGELASDGRSLIHVFYSGNAQNSDSFKYYLTQYQDTSELTTNTYEHRPNQNGDLPASHDSSSLGLGSGHFVFEAKGGRKYDIKTKIVGDLIESTFAEDKILTSDDGSDNIIAVPDDYPPSQINNFTVDRIDNNSQTLEFNWDAPSESDVDTVVVFTGASSEHFVGGGTKDNPYTSHNPISYEDGGHFVFSANKKSKPKFLNIYDFLAANDLQAARDLSFHAVAVDTSSNTGVATSKVSINVVDDTNYYAAPEAYSTSSLEQKKDGSEYSKVYVFYSGQGQHSPLFSHYDIKWYGYYGDVLQAEIDNTKADPSRTSELGYQYLGGGSGYKTIDGVGGEFYYAWVKTVDKDGRESPSTIVGSWASKDTTAPATPTGLTAFPSQDNIIVNWTNPIDRDLSHTILYTGLSSSLADSSWAKWRESRDTMELLPMSWKQEEAGLYLKDFVGESIYFSISAVDKSNNESSKSSAVYSNLEPYRWAMGCDSIHTEADIETDLNGDGSAKPAIKVMVKESIPNALYLRHAREYSHYNIQIAKNSNFVPLVNSLEFPIGISGDTTEFQQGQVLPTLMSGSGRFENLQANTDYYIRARRRLKNGTYDDNLGRSAQKGYIEYCGNAPTKTLKDQTIPNNPNNFYITSGPKQVFLEWNWPQGADADLASILIYKTGIPTGRLNENSSEDKYCWKSEHISGYFDDFSKGANDYTYRINPGTAFIDSDIETGIFSGYGVDSINWHDEPKQKVFYHYLLKTVDSSNNTGIGFVSGMSSSPHVGSPNEKYGDIGHTQGYVTGGGVDDSYIESVRAGKILTDRITSNTFILANPSGRIVSDNVYAKGLDDARYMFATGSGIYIDHKMFRIGDPSPGGEGLFFTGEKNLYGNFENPNFTKGPGGLYSHDIEPNTLEIRGHMTAGTIEIGSDLSTTLRVDSDGTLSIGDQATTITGWFTGDPNGVSASVHSGIFDPNIVQLVGNDSSSALFSNPANYYGTFIEVNWFRGGSPYKAASATNKEGVHWGREVRGLQSLLSDGTPLNDGVARLNSPSINLTEMGEADYQGHSGVMTTGSIKYLPTDDNNPRDYWRLIDVKFKVTNDGRLFARDATIAGTVTANSFEASKTLILGDKGSEETSIIQSLGYKESVDCSVPSGWRIRGDGKAWFSDVNIFSGSISGTKLKIGKCGSSDYFNVDSEGNMFIGPSNVWWDLESNDFVVTNQGKLYASNAYLSGTTTISGLLKVKDGLIIGENTTPPYIRFTDDYIGSFPDASSPSVPGFLLRANGISDFSQVNVSGGMISGATLAIGDETPGNDTRFYVRNDGSISIGNSFVKEDNKFYVDKDGNLRAENAAISGDFTLEGTALVGNGLRLGAADGIMIDDDSIRSAGWSYTSQQGFMINKDGEAHFNNIMVTGGAISGTNIIIGDGYNFRVNTDGELSIGTPADIGAPYYDQNFWVDNKGNLFSKSARISGALFAGEGLIGGLYIGTDYIASASDVDKGYTWHRSDYGYDVGETGLFLARDGQFSISNWQGNVIEHNPHVDDFVIITGLRSKSAPPAIGGDGKGQGFYIRGGDGNTETSELYNFITDPYSATGIAKQIDTQICGEIPFPIASTTYTIIYNSRVPYEVYAIDAKVDTGGSWGSANLAFVINATTKNVAIDSTSNETNEFESSPVAIGIGQNLTVTMPADTHSATSVIFNVALKRGP